jgi:dihydrofolate reductase
MKRQSGKDLIIFGSGSIVSQLTQHGLIDEYQFVVCPILLGSGQPLFSGVSKYLRLDLLETKPLLSGDVILRYARQEPKDILAAGQTLYCPKIEKVLHLKT